jgi:hypothetical protein
MSLALLWKLRHFIGAASLLLSLGGAYGYLRIHYYNEGYNAAISDIAAKNKDALDAVEAKLKIVDDCSNSGGEWDTTRGVCGQR